jgi:DNA mismatch repair protein MutL
MAQTIQILPENLANKIAAGEVIQRPASAVKEMIENSIDAHAKSISVIIEEGGKNVIQVIDDGVGMSVEDARIAFERHSTSKIKTYDDLENITTLGFRGEALASIASVAQVEMITRTSSTDTAIKIKIRKTGIIEQEPCSGPVGTSITAKNLFYNTPGRKNFLKSTPTEFNRVIEAVQRMAISYPEISWKFISDGETIFNFRSSDYKDRLINIFGEKLASSLLQIEEANDLLYLKGYLSRPDFFRKTRSEQYLFLNRRYILNRSISYAVVQAYENLLLKGTFPVFVLFIEINPRLVDVNVHPTKMEVKFNDERGIYRFVAASVRKILGESDLIPVIHGKSMSLPQTSLIPKMPLAPVGKYLDLITEERKSDQGQVMEQVNKSGTDFSSTKSPEELTNPEHMPRASDAFAEAGHNLQLFNKYIISIVDDGFYLIDQHAAHERILYERAVDKMTAHKSETQELLFPHTLQMSASDVALVKELLPLIQSLGFSLKFFSSSTIIIDGVPPDVRPGKEKTILQDIVDAYKEDEHDVPLAPYERLAKSFACKAAIKAGDPLKVTEIRALISELFSCKIPFSCPHGRPVAVKFPISELDRRFGRSS